MRSSHGKAIGAMILLISLALPSIALGNVGPTSNHWVFKCGPCRSYEDGPIPMRIVGTSYLANDAADCSPASAIDGDIGTAWVEGVDGPGIGESLTLNIGIPAELWNIGLLAGYFASPELLAANNRLKKVQITLSDGTSITEEFEDSSTTRVVHFDDIHVVEWIRLTILEVYPGTRWDDTAISELAVNYIEGY